MTVYVGMKVTKQNWKKIVKKLKEKNKMVYTRTGKKIPARKAKFQLELTVDGTYDISARWK